ncbi:MAG: ATP-binding cassette domain-containing protein [Actinomycetota bacterium]|nr:ATP-binding cassette domain-containing protein [Actinomycetota bacterium]
MSLAVHAQELTKVYPDPEPVTAVDGIDLEVPEGAIFGLLGPNGAGKTTTVGMCTTRVVPSSGRVTVTGLDVTEDPPMVRKRIGVVSQFNTLDRSCTVFDNVAFHCRYFGMGARPAKRRAGELLESFGLSDKASTMPETLSGGMAQRLLIVRAVAHHPELLFLDEPSAGLDPQSRIALWDVLLELHRSGTTIVLTTHYMEEADRLCQQIAIIDFGKILVCDTPVALKQQVSAETVVELKVQHPSEEVAGPLRGLPGVLRVEFGDGVLRLFMRERDGLLPRVVEVAQPAGLRDISISEPTLETVFITLTGRALRE